MQLDVHGISKRWGNTRALTDVSATLRPGRIHALAGENGAGKSTLLKIMAGVETPDTGTLSLGGQPYRPSNLRDAERNGVALVFQELTVNFSLSIAENIYIDRLRRFGGRLGFLDQRKLNAAAQDIADRLGLGIDVTRDIDSLDLGQLKCIEISRALSSNPSVVLLDESTAFLGHHEVDAVLGVMRRLRDQGVTLAFVSHHVDEVIGVADSVIVLKDGHLVGELEGAAITAGEIHARMVGREIAGNIYPARTAPAGPARPVLDIRDLALVEGAPPISLTVGAGEVMGVAGLKGSGGEDLLALLAGDRPHPKGGYVQLEDAPYAPRRPSEAWAAGASYLPGDRAREGLITDFSVLDNITMPAPPRRGPFFDLKRATAMAAAIVARLGVKTDSLAAPCATLSGGNMQKIVLGKCLATGPRLLLLNNPTRGVDIGARQDIYRVIRELVDAGMAVLLVSEDLPELLGLSDRLTVMRRGAVSARFDLATPCTEHELIGHMV